MSTEYNKISEKTANPTKGNTFADSTPKMGNVTPSNVPVPGVKLKGDYKREVFMVDVKKLYLRETPVRKTNVVTILKKDDILYAIEFSGEYLKVETKDGNVGYVAKQYIKAV